MKQKISFERKRKIYWKKFYTKSNNQKSEKNTSK